MGWGKISKPANACKLDEHVRDISPEDRNWTGIDIGQVQPVAAYISQGSALPGVEDGHAEAVATLGCGSLTELQKQYNRATSHRNNNLGTQIDLDWFPLYNLPLPPPPPCPSNVGIDVESRGGDGFGVIRCSCPTSACSAPSDTTL